MNINDQAYVLEDLGTSMKDQFYKKNIKRVFEKTEIWPLKSLITVKQLQKQSSELFISSKLPLLSTTIPILAGPVHQLIKSFSFCQKETLLEGTIMKLITKYEIQSFENQDLQNTIT